MKKHLLKSLLALALVLITGNAWGETVSVELCTDWNITLAYATGYTQDYTIDDLSGGTATMTLGVQGVYRQSKTDAYFQMNKKTGYFKNTTKLPGKITKIETTWSVAKGATKCYFAENDAASSSDKTVTVTAATSVTYTPPTDADYYFFNIDVSTGSGSAQMTSCKVYYENSNTPTKPSQTLSFAESAIEVALDNTEFVGQTVSGAQTTVVYESSNTGVATVNASTGAVTLVDYGQSTITATAAETDDYNGASSSYTITVFNPNEETVEFVFNTDAGLSALGITKPNVSNGTNLGTTTYTVNPISMSATNGSTATRVWNSNGSTDLRIYKDGGSITFTGATITRIEITGSKLDKLSSGENGTYSSSNGTWIGSSNSVTLTASDGVNIMTVAVTYNKTTVSATYKVTYEANGGAGSITDENEYDAQGEVTVMSGAGLTKTGYTFTGWNTLANGTGTAYSAGSTFNISQNTILYAQWSINSYTLTYQQTEGATFTVKDADDNEIASGSSVRYDAKVKLFVEIDRGYSFKDYTITYGNEQSFTKQKPESTFTMPAGDAVLTLNLTPSKQYSVTFYDKGEQYAAANVYEGETLADALNDVQEPVSDDSFEGYSFQGWSTNQDVDNLNIINDEYVITANTELFAVFGKAGESASYRKVTSEPTDWSGNYLIVYNDSRAFNGVDAANGYVDVTSNNGVISDPNGGATIIIAPMEGGYSLKVNGGTNNGKYISGQSGSNTIVFGTTAVANTISMSGEAVTILSNSTSFRYNKQSGNDRFRFYKTATTGDNYVLPQLYKEEGGTAGEYSLEGPQIQNVTISAVGWATACIPFKATITSKNATAYYVKTDNGASLVKTEATVIPAGEGILLKSNNGGEATVTFTISAEDADEVTDNYMKGSLTGETFSGEGKYYILANDAAKGLGFYWQSGTSGTSANCGQNKAVLVVPASSPSATLRGFSFGDATQIENVNAVEADKYFDLMGREVLNPAGGIYILNGKKVLVK